MVKVEIHVDQKLNVFLRTQSCSGTLRRIPYAHHRPYAAIMSPTNDFKGLQMEKQGYQKIMQ